ncbi:MAG: SCO1664 family protein [Actinomycetota bacterium]
MPADALKILREGEMEVLGLLPYSSNYTFLAKVSSPDEQLLAVYKPRRGERPLWDFPPGSLAAREVAAYRVSEEAGWNIVPPTVLRRDAPLGEGSVQLFIEHDPERHYFVLMDEYRDELAAFAAFDVVANNADRKSGHVLEDPHRELWAVDHGVTFHAEPKLRTVIWDYAEEPISDGIRHALERLRASLSDERKLGGEMARLLTPAERSATLHRVEALLARSDFPSPGPDRPVPWPLI